VTPPEKGFEEVLDEVLEEDPRYAREAYVFVQLALNHYRERHAPEEEPAHVTGPELLVGVRELALDQYGPLARTVLNNWGLQDGSDVGEIVYNLIRHHLMSKSDDDRREDFDGVMRFDESMDREYGW